MTKTKSSSDVAGNLHEIAERARALAGQAEQLEAAMRRVRGTREIRPARRVDTIDPAASTPLLYAHVERLLRRSPLTFRDLMAALGAGTNENRVKGVLVRLQRDGRGVVNLGDGARAVWFIPDAAARARLRK